jgi:phosphoserine phosphatase RsbU/P
VPRIPEGFAINPHEQTFFSEQLSDRKGRLRVTLNQVGASPELERLLGEVDAALERIGAGTFGYCETCHDAIERDRLKVDPLLRNCLDHLSRSEQLSLERDLDLACQVQRNLLPKSAAVLSGWKTAFAYEPAGPVSGDYCDLIADEAGGGGFYFLLGDVSGKGVAASLMVASLHTLFRSVLASSPSLPVLLNRANRLVCEGTLSSHYVTLVCGRAHPEGRVELTNAGHCLPLILRQGRVERIESHGVPLGLFCSAAYPSQEITLGEGESVLLFSDGLVEAMTAEGAQYGEDRLDELVWQMRHEDPRSLVDVVLEDLREFQRGNRRHDDMTLLAVQRTAQRER